MCRIAINGYGFMGAVHARAILATPGLELCGIISRRQNPLVGTAPVGNQGCMDQSGERLLKVPVFQTMEACIAGAKPDAVSICLPLSQHYAAARQALELGLDVLVEKPFCPEPWQCRDLIGIAKGLGRILMVAHCVRFDPVWELLAECIADRRHGALQLLRTSRLAGEPAWGSWLNSETRRASGGALLDLLIHDIDFAISCLGRPEGAACHRNLGEYWEACLTFPGGTQVGITGGFLHRNAAFRCEYTAIFERASLCISSLRPGIVQIATDHGEDVLRVHGDAYVNEITYFASCIATRHPPQRCPPEESLCAVSTCLVLRMDSERPRLMAAAD